jgi:hypothetical protein
VILLATCYCRLFGYTSDSLKSKVDDVPTDVAGFCSAFAARLRAPEPFVKDLIELRCQAVLHGTAMQVVDLARDSEASPEAFKGGGDHAELLRKLAVYLRAAMDCAEIYGEIRMAASKKQLDERQASELLDGSDSDQKRMLDAMARTEADVEAGHFKPDDGVYHPPRTRRERDHFDASDHQTEPLVPGSQHRHGRAKRWVCCQRRRDELQTVPTEEAE